MAKEISARLDQIHLDRSELYISHARASLMLELARTILRSDFKVMYSTQLSSRSRSLYVLV